MIVIPKSFVDTDSQSIQLVVLKDSKYHEYIKMNNKNKDFFFGEIIVTSANGKGDSKKIFIKPTPENDIVIDFK